MGSVGSWVGRVGRPGAAACFPRTQQTPSEPVQAQLNQTLKWGTGLSTCSACYRELFKSSVRSESLFFCKSVKYMDEMYIYAHTHANHRWSYVKSGLCPLGFVGGTVLPFLIPGNTDRCRANGFLVLDSSAQIQALTAAVVCIGKLEKDFTKLSK